MLSRASSLYASTIFNAKKTSTSQLHLAYVWEARDSISARGATTQSFLQQSISFHGFVVIHRDGHGFFAAYDNDKFLAPGNSCV
jgi:hypothetical protein